MEEKSMSRATRIRITALTALSTLLTLLPASGTWAQSDGGNYPSRPVRIVIPFPPGSSDAVARMLSQRLAETMGQPFVIENRAGASGVIGTDTVAKAQPDGYTLLFPTCAFPISAVGFSKLPYDSVRDFEPVARVTNSPMVLVANPKLAANSVTELIALAKSKPGVLNYASNGAGSITSLAMVQLMSMTNTKITDIPYKGAGPSLVALMAGEVQVMIAPLGAVLQYVRAGRLKALAMASGKRSPQVPDLPTLAESGVTGFDATCWYGVLAPRGTPERVINTLNRQILAALATPDFNTQLTSMGLEPAPSSPAQLGDYIKAEIARWGKAFKDSGADLITP
jgi:tripartite-type tricarboxylate transporter receptor subunit TctC